MKNFLLVCSCFAVMASGVAGATEKKEVAVAPNELDKVVLKQLTESTVEVRLETNKLLPSAPILFEKAKNVYFISLPSTAYNGERKLKLKKFEDGLKDITIDFVPYKVTEDNGYTRIVIETKGDTSLKVLNVESIGSKAIAIVLISAFLGLIAVTVCLAGGYYTYKRLSSKRTFKKMFDVENIEIESVSEENGEELVADILDVESSNTSSDDYVVEMEEAVDLYPSADEIVSDILNNEEAIIEISDAVASEVEEQLLELESEEDEVLEEENNFDAIAFSPSSAGAVLEPKVFDFSQASVVSDEDSYSDEDVTEDDEEDTFEPVEVLSEAENTNVEYPEEDDVDFVQLAQDEFVDDEYAPEIQEDDDSVFDDIVSGELQTTDYENIEADILLQEDSLEVDLEDEIVEEEQALSSENEIIEEKNLVDTAVDLDDVDDDEPEVLAAQGITDDKAIYLIKQAGVVSLLGTVGDEAFLLNTFEKEPEDTNITLFENEEKENEVIYIVKVGSWRALISITDDSMKNILTLS